MEVEPRVTLLDVLRNRLQLSGGGRGSEAEVRINPDGTGASSGIGAATARAAAMRKVRLALVARSESKLAGVAAEARDLSQSRFSTARWI